MARFYKTASANPLDYMYKMNTPLMERVLLTNDAAITDNLGALGKLNDAATAFPYLQADEGRAREIASGYSTKIDDLSRAIQEDPANWRKQMTPLKDLQRELQNNYRTGEIGKIMGNYSQYKTTSDYLDKAMESYNKDGKGVSAERARAYKQNFLTNFKGTNYDPTSGDYNAIKVFNPMNNMDIRKSLSEELDKMKADGTIRITDETTGTGEYFNKETHKWEGISPDKILRIATGRLNNPQLMDYLKQDSQVGLINGVFNMDQSSPEYGKFINPYNYEKVSLTSGEQAMIDNMKNQISKTKNRNTREMLETQLKAYSDKLESRTQVNWNKDSYLAPILRSITDQFSYQQTEDSNDISANGIWQTKFTQAQTNARNNQDIASREKMQGRLLDHQKQLQDDRIAADKELKLLELANKTSKLKPGEKDTSKRTDNAVVGTSYSTPFYWTTEEKDKMTIGLNDEIIVNKNTVQQLETTLADIVKSHPNDKILIANAENKLGSEKSKLNALQARRDDVINYAVNEWKAKGSNADYEYSDFNERVVRDYLGGDTQKRVADADAEVKNLNKELPQRQQDKAWLNNTYYPAKARLGSAQAALASGRKIFDKEIKSYSDTKLEKAAKETTNSNLMVSSTDAQDDMILEMINATPSNYKIRNSEGKEINLSFEHGTAVADKKNVKIRGVSATTGLGNKQIEILATVNGQNVIITPADDGKLNNYFSGQFKQSKDKDVSNVGKILGSPTASTLADMMTEVRMNTGTSYGVKDAWVYKTIPNPANPRETIRVRTRSISTGASQPKWEFQFETADPTLIAKYAGRGNSYTLDGKSLKGFVPLVSTRSPTGEYANLEDIISIFPED